MSQRGVGYCLNPECGEYAKSVFLINPTGQISEGFRCPRCRQSGLAKLERGSVTREGAIFDEVRVEYNFDPLSDTYREIAVVRDESLRGQGSSYTFQSPLMRTELRALKVAEALLANLNRYGGSLSSGIPSTREVILSFDKPFEAFAQDCGILYEELRQSNLVERRLGT